MKWYEPGKVLFSICIGDVNSKPFGASLYSSADPFETRLEDDTACKWGARRPLYTVFTQAAWIVSECRGGDTRRQLLGVTIVVCGELAQCLSPSHLVRVWTVCSLRARGTILRSDLKAHSDISVAPITIISR